MDKCICPWIFNNWGNISGRDTAFDPEDEMHTETETDHETESDDHAAPMEAEHIDYMAPTMDPNLRGGTRGSVSVGLNFIVPNRFGGILAGQRFAAEFQMPVYENLDGPQMALGWTIVAGRQYAFALW